MNAFYALYRAISRIQMQRSRSDALHGSATRRDVWVQIGWLYVDTTMILSRVGVDGAIGGLDDAPGASHGGSGGRDEVAYIDGFVPEAKTAGSGSSLGLVVPRTPTAGPAASPSDGGIEGLHPAVGVTSAPGGIVLSITNASDSESIRSVFSACGDRIAGVVTEVPTNPSVRCGDLALLRELCDGTGAALVLDPTMCSPFCADVTSLADATVVSLTKYFGSGANVMAGALSVNPDRPLGKAMMPGGEHEPVPEAPAVADLAAVVNGAADVPGVVPLMLRNTAAVAAVAARWLPV